MPILQGCADAVKLRDGNLWPAAIKGTQIDRGTTCQGCLRPRACPSQKTATKGKMPQAAGGDFSALRHKYSL
jgi:hypothetical protein